MQTDSLVHCFKTKLAVYANTSTTANQPYYWFSWCHCVSPLSPHPAGKCFLQLY